MRIGGWLCLVTGAVCLVAAVVLGVRAIQQASDISAYQHARACPAGAPADASCLQKVDGSVTGVTQFAGGYRISPVYALDVQTGSRTLHLTFNSDNPMLDYAVDGDPAVVTLWHGVPVSVVTDGRSGFTVAEPRTAFGGYLRGAGKTAFVGVFFALGGWAMWWRRKQARSQPLPPGHVRTRRPAVRARVLARRAIEFVPMLLTVAVLFGVFGTVMDGPPAREYRQAPACAGERNLASCAGDFTAVINGVRAPAGNDNGYADVAYVTPDGAINAWVRFDGNATALARAATAAEDAQTPLRIRVWRRAIVGAQLGGSWHWAEGDPPGNTKATLLLAISTGLLFSFLRLRIHRRPRLTEDRQDVISDDLGQPALAAGGIVLLAMGYWPGAILVLAALAWLGLSIRHSSGAIMCT